MKKTSSGNHFKAYLLLFMVIISASVLFAAQAQALNLEWDPVLDGDLSGYYVRYGYTSGNYTTTIDVGNKANYTLSGLTEGKTYYIVTQAYGREGLKSSFSNEVVYSTQGENPDPDGGELPGDSPTAPYDDPSKTLGDPTVPVSDTVDYSGWWYDPVETGGNGIALEVQHGNPNGDVIYLGWYSYNEAGEPVWYTSGNLMTDSTSYSGTLRQWTGWALGGAPGAFQSVEIGTIEITFASAGQAQITWTLNAGGTGTKTIYKFMNDMAPGAPDSRGLKGWWMDPQNDGVGVFIEAQGDGLYMAFYHYREDGTARWWSSGDLFADGASTYSGEFDQWENGRCLNGPHVVPDLPTHPTSVTIEFHNNTQATMTWDGGQLNLERFQFFNMGVTS